MGLVDGIIGGVASIFTNKSNQKNQQKVNQQQMDFQREQQEKNNKFNAKEAEKQRDWQTKMSNTEVSRRMADMRASGLNPAFQQIQDGSTPQGAQAAAASPSGTSSVMAQYQNPFQGLNGSIQDIYNGLMMSAQLKNLKEDTRAKRIENDRREVEDSTYANNYSEITDSNGVVIDDLEKWIEDHPGELPDVVKVSSKGGKGRFDAQRNINAFKQEVSDVNTQILRNQLESLVTRGKIDDPQVVLAMTKIPDAEFKKVLEETKTLMSQSSMYDAQSGKLNSEKLLIDLEKKLKEESNFMPYIDKMFNGKFEFKDFGKMLILSLMTWIGKH